LLLALDDFIGCKVIEKDVYNLVFREDGVTIGVFFQARAPSDLMKTHSF
jgi:hypothetical protein